MNDNRAATMRDVSSQEINLADLVDIMNIEHPLQINDLTNRINGMTFQHTLNVNQYDIMDIMEVDEITELNQGVTMKVDKIIEQVSDAIRRGRKRKYEEFIEFNVEVPEKRQRRK